MKKLKNDKMDLIEWFSFYENVWWQIKYKETISEAENPIRCW
jgi:hypothetical protein